jgi:hypothetical protein
MEGGQYGLPGQTRAERGRLAGVHTHCVPDPCPTSRSPSDTAHPTDRRATSGPVAMERCHDAGFVGEHDGLHAVAQAELHEQPRYVGLHC